MGVAVTIPKLDDVRVTSVTSEMTSDRKRRFWRGFVAGIVPRGDNRIAKSVNGRGSILNK